MQLLFAYGTLMYGLPGHRLLAGSVFAGRGCTRGLLYICDGYPLLVTGGESCVWGELYQVSEALLPRIDWYEGAGSPSSPWRRISVKVDVAGLLVDAMAYGLSSKDEAARLCEKLEGPVEHGDYGRVARRGPPRWLVAVPIGAEQPPGLMLGASTGRLIDATLSGYCVTSSPGSRIETTIADILAEHDVLAEWAGSLGCSLHGVEAEVEGVRVYPVAPLGARG